MRANSLIEKLSLLEDSCLSAEYPPSRDLVFGPDCQTSFCAHRRLFRRAHYLALVYLFVRSNSTYLQFSRTTSDNTAVSRVAGRCEQKPMPT